MPAMVKRPKVAIMLACNDWRNGNHTGHVEGFVIGDVMTLTLCAGQPMRCQVLVSQKRKSFVKIGRRIFDSYGYAQWVGNWCWDQVLVSEQTAADLVNFLRSVTSGGHPKWSIEHGTTEKWNKWVSGEKFLASDFS